MTKLIIITNNIRMRTKQPRDKRTKGNSNDHQTGATTMTPSDYKLITILSIAIILNTATDIISRQQLDHKLNQQTHKHQQPTHCNQTTQTIQK